MSLYTKYRPRDWDSVIGQSYTTTILRNALKSDRVNHAYLFHGARGTGKTSSARILAKGVNCTNLQDGNPCHRCEHCQAFDNGTMLDCIEIDAASNTGVDNIRELIEKARFEPNQGKFKIYIIDEVHMLSTGAFNALLKTLEEPPEHVKFILATTEIEKVPETIRSRTLRFDFRKITLDDIIARLQFVCASENIHAEAEALKLIARVARGGLRDALTLLEQNTIDQEVRTEHVRYTLALVDDAVIDQITRALVEKDVTEILSIIETLSEGHIDARGLLEQLLYRLRDAMREHLDDGLFPIYQEILGIIRDGHARVRSIPDGMLLIELTLLQAVKRAEISASKQQNQTSTPSPTPKPAESTKKEATPQAIIPSKPEPPISHESLINTPSITQPKKPETLVPPESPAKKNFSYPVLINHLKSIQPALTVDLKTARFQLDDTVLTLIFSKKWNYDRVNLPKTKNILTEALEVLFGNNYNIECRLQESGHGNLAHAVDEVF